MIGYLATCLRQTLRAAIAAILIQRFDLPPHPLLRLPRLARLAGDRDIATADHRQGLILVRISLALSGPR